MGFYARRVRRILPAATLVIIVTVVLSYIVLGVLGGDSAAVDGRWAAVFLANFHFASTGANYLNANALPSPLQNYWSLSVEEQFYLVYPTLFLVITSLKGTITREARLAIGLSIVVVVSFVLSVTQTSFNPVTAYYSPFTRAWELALGALVAVGARWLVRLPKSLAAGFTWAGLLGIVTAAFLFNAQTPYPGSAVALPVIGAALIIAAGTAVPKFGAELVLGLPHFQWLGRISYSLYLWHWPILMLAAESAGKASLPFSQNLWWLLVALVASVLSYRLIENPVRRSRFLARRRVVSVGIGITLVVVTVVTLTLQINGDNSGGGSSLAGLSNLGSVATAQELTDLLASAPQITKLPSEMIPPLSEAPNDAALASGIGTCWPSYGQSSGPLCVSGDPHGTRTIVIYGDSHGAMWSKAIEDIAQAAHWKLVMLVKSSCPVDMLPYGNPPAWGPPSADFSACDHFHQWALGVIERLQPNMLVVSQEVRLKPDNAPYSPQRWGKALQNVLQSVKSRSPRTQEVVLGNIPQLSASAPQCLSRNPDDVQACSSQPNSYLFPIQRGRTGCGYVGGWQIHRHHSLVLWNDNVYPSHRTLRGLLRQGPRDDDLRRLLEGPVVQSPRPAGSTLTSSRSSHRAGPSTQRSNSLRGPNNFRWRNGHRTDSSSRASTGGPGNLGHASRRCQTNRVRMAARLEDHRRAKRQLRPSLARLRRCWQGRI